MSSSASSLRHTPLHSRHVQAGARMVDFGGWHMPLAYGSQLEEHHTVRCDAGMFDVSHMQVVDLIGEGIRAFLRHLLANDVDKLTVPGKALYSCMLNPQGGVIDDLIVYFFSEGAWRLVVNAGTAQKDIAWMRGRASESFPGVQLLPRADLAIIAVQGPQARQKVWAARPAWQEVSEALKPFNAATLPGNVMVARTGYTGEDGFEVVLPADAAGSLWDDLHRHGVTPCGLGARDTLRLEAGMNLYGQDMDETVSPMVSGLAWTVSFADPERNFIGRDAIEQAAVDSNLVGLKLAERGVMRAHMAVRTDVGDGEITSGTMSPTIGGSIGLARVPLGVEPGQAVQVEIRGKWLPAEVVKLPFVRHGKILVG